jgi:hypothetical protein
MGIRLKVTDAIQAREVTVKCWLGQLVAYCKARFPADGDIIAVKNSACFRGDRSEELPDEPLSLIEGITLLSTPGNWSVMALKRWTNEADEELKRLRKLHAGFKQAPGKRARQSQRNKKLVTALKSPEYNKFLDDATAWKNANLRDSYDLGDDMLLMAVQALHVRLRYFMPSPQTKPQTVQQFLKQMQVFTCCGVHEQQDIISLVANELRTHWDYAAAPSVQTKRSAHHQRTAK